MIAAKKHHKIYYTHTVPQPTCNIINTLNNSHVTKKYHVMPCHGHCFSQDAVEAQLAQKEAELQRTSDNIRAQQEVGMPWGSQDFDLWISTDF